LWLVDVTTQAGPVIVAFARAGERRALQVALAALNIRGVRKNDAVS